MVPGGEVQVDRMRRIALPPPPYPATAQIEAEVGPAHIKPFSTRAIVSPRLKVTAHFTRATCKGSNCT